MKINWKVRFKNRAWLYALLALTVSFVYDTLAMFDVFPSFGEDWVMNVVEIALMLLTAVGVVVDPTTAGLNDSERALGYEEPYNESEVTE